MKLFLAVMRKDIRIALQSYAFFLYEIFGVVFQCAIFSGISIFVTPGAIDSYAQFVVPALGAVELMTAALQSSRCFLQRELDSGSMEQIAGATPPLWYLAVLESAFPVLKALLVFFLYWLARYFIPGEKSLIPIFPVLLGLVLVIIQFWCCGLFAAGFLLWKRRGNIVNSGVQFAALLLGGVYFPAKKLPASMEMVSQCSALNFLNTALRGDVVSILPALSATAAAVFLGIRFFRFCEESARRSGMLVVR